jgi:hypothetical protein
VTGTPAEEEHRRAEQHRLERWTACQPEQPGPRRPDPVHVLRVCPHEQPGTEVYFLARWSLVARLRRDAEGSGDRLDDLGPDAMLIAQAARRGQWHPGELARIGVARGGRWLRWEPPGFPVEPVPGSPGATARNN